MARAMIGAAHGWRHARLLLLWLGLALLSGCGLPPLEGRAVSTARFDTDDTRLGRAITPLVEAHPGTSGVHPLADGLDAYAARVLLARTAERTLDVAYYIWRDDLTGTMLFQELHAAADRGVRVRLLLDDNGTAGIDHTLALLDTHPNIEVRLFNPFVPRWPKWLGYVTDFSRVNHRMHNKSFTADSQATIIGGRNVGDEYFSAGEGTLFADLDVLAVGPVVADVARDFDRYWNSGSAYPTALLLKPVAPDAIEELAVRASATAARPDAQAYVEELRGSTLVQELDQRRLPLHWAPTRMISDDPAKALGEEVDRLVVLKLADIIGEAKQEMDLVSPYFVPAEAGTAAFGQLAAGGVRLRVLTNSLEATDVAVVHAGYAKRRKALLRAGIVLYELRRQPGDPQAASLIGSSGSSAASLHAKTFQVDRSRIFIGSFNFDPRSAHLNTEMGFVIDSPELAQAIAHAFDWRIPMDAYQVHLAPDGSLYWTELVDGSEVRYDTEPGTTAIKRAGVAVMALLPIDWLL